MKKLTWMLVILGLILILVLRDNVKNLNHEPGESDSQGYSNEEIIYLLDIIDE